MTWPLYPIDGRPFRLTMGLRAVPIGDWILDRSDWGEQLALKHELLRTEHDAVFAALPASEAGATELLTTLVAHLAEYLPHRVEVRENGAVVVDRTTGLQTTVADFHPLEAAARLVPDDLTVQVREEHEWVLVGASVCFPSRWVLAEKVGRGLDAVHDPVPGYDEALRPAMTGTFDKLRPDRIVERINWTIPDDPTLFQPVPPGRRHQAAAPNGPELSPADVVAGLWLRIERQTVRLLPHSRAAVFSIGTYVDPLTALADDAEALRGLIGTLPTVPARNLTYKGIVHAAGAIESWAEERLAELRE